MTKSSKYQQEKRKSGSADRVNAETLWLGALPSYGTLDSIMYSPLSAWRSQLEHLANLKVLILFGSNQPLSEQILIFKEFTKSYENVQFILIDPLLPDTELIQLCNSVSVSHLLIGPSQEEAEVAIREAIETYGEIIQNRTLMQLFEEQNELLSQQYEILEAAVHEREESIQRTNRRIEGQLEKLEFLSKLLANLEAASSIFQIENLLTSLIFDPKEKARIRILPEAQLNHIEKTQPHQRILHFVAKAEAYVLVATSSNKISADQSKKIQLTLPAVNISVERIESMKQVEEIEFQWKTTFDAFDEPIALIDSDYSVVRFNKSFSASPEDNVKCYAKLFNRDEPCPNCRLGSRFLLTESDTDSKRAYLEVSSQRVNFSSKQSIYVNIYKDVTKREISKRKQIQNARMAELGIIGSSIAHEINNPLAGMLTFLHLLMADKNLPSEIQADVQLMNEGALRCKSMVEKLLSFTRRPEEIAESSFDLSNTTMAVLEILELQTRALGLNIQLEQSDEHPPVFGIEALIFQALLGFLQEAFRLIAQAGLAVPPRIEISSVEMSLVITICLPSELALREAPQGPLWGAARQILAELDVMVSSGLDDIGQFLLSISLPIDRNSISRSKSLTAKIDTVN
ncbi:MAG: hypothetical protein COT74_03695 [Bdellovibrionales bacterium CG10_big_fil_rev_8_21_14_0_10_45_34]|nr:MAG: hypothetical protein COT74_03695 [Bdellovibrionales bacterium CG10_big_fil_rev_8_21_14_0_10_45_34]